MTTMEATTVIDAPIELCFSLSLSIDLELLAAEEFHLRAVGGVTSGKIGPKQRVTWETRQFGWKVRHTSEITGFDEPTYFEDSMVAGLFRSFRHKHYFEALSSSRTLMRDRMSFAFPYLLGGVIVERLLVKRRLGILLRRRNAIIQQQAERLSQPLNPA